MNLVGQIKSIEILH